MPITENLMGFGFECGDGWHELIETLSEQLESLIRRFVGEYPNCIFVPCATQVKEKYGSLCFYMSSATDEMFDWIDQAECLSEEICEECGKESRIKRKLGGWYYRNLCLHCFMEIKGQRERGIWCNHVIATEQ